MKIDHSFTILCKFHNKICVKTNFYETSIFVDFSAGIQFL